LNFIVPKKMIAPYGGRMMDEIDRNVSEMRRVNCSGMQEKLYPICAGYLGHLFVDRDVREHDLARITHRLHTEMPLPRKWRTGKPMLTEYAWRPLGNQAEGWRVLFVRKRKWGRECTTALSP
jgi:hypothetical protein